MLFISNPQIFWVEARALSRCGETPGRPMRMWDTGGRPLRVKPEIQSSCADRGGDSLANPLPQRPVQRYQSLIRGKREREGEKTNVVVEVVIV